MWNSQFYGLCTCASNIVWYEFIAFFVCLIFVWLYCFVMYRLIQKINFVIRWRHQMKTSTNKRDLFNVTLPCYYIYSDKNVYVCDNYLCLCLIRWFGCIKLCPNVYFTTITLFILRIHLLRVHSQGCHANCYPVW